MIPDLDEALVKLADVLAGFRSDLGVPSSPPEDASPEYVAGWVDGMLNAAQITLRTAARS